MSHHPPVHLLSDSDSDSYTTPISDHPKKRFRPNVDSLNPTNLITIDDDPTPLKFPKSSSSSDTPFIVPDTPLIVPDTPFSEESKPLGVRPVSRLPSSHYFSLPSSSTPPGPTSLADSDLIPLESDEEVEKGLGKGSGSKNGEARSGTDIAANVDSSLEFPLKEKKLEGGALTAAFDAEKWLDIDSTYCLSKPVQNNVHNKDGTAVNPPKGAGCFIDVDSGPPELVKTPVCAVKQNDNGKGRPSAGFEMQCLEESPIVVWSISDFENLQSTKVLANSHHEVDTNQIQHLDRDQDHDEKNVEQERDTMPTNGGHKANVKKRQRNEEKEANLKKSKEEKLRLKEEKKRQKEQEKLDKDAMKKKQKLENFKFNENHITAFIDSKVINLGTIGGYLITKLRAKDLQVETTSNPIEKSIVWRLAVPEELSQDSSIIELPYILLIYEAEDFCRSVNDGSLMDHISSVQAHYPAYKICCLTNRLMSYINKREQDMYKKRKDANEWKRPPMEEVFAKLTTQFSNVHSRMCADEAELAEHVFGLTVNLAKCHSRKKLTRLSVSANGSNVPKDCADRAIIMKNPWLKALVCIPKVQPRFAIAIGKKYPSMKSLLSVYLDPSKSVHEKEFLLEDLPLEGIIGNEDRRLGEMCSKRVYRILMAQNGSINTEDVETGADFHA